MATKPSDTRTMVRVTRLAAIIIAFAASVASADNVRIGYVSGGLYEQFVKQKLVGIAIDGTEFVLVETQGSRDQIEKLRSGEIDLAIVQSDIAYYAYEGVRGYKEFSEFSLVLPLFEEYVQVIVRADSDIHTLGRLLDGTVSIGQRGSGSYQNAMDLFDQLGFRDGIDFQLAQLPTQEALQALQKRQIKGVVFTSGMFPAIDSIEPSKFRVLSIPDVVLEALTIRSPYYSKSSYTRTGIANARPINTASVSAALVASTNVDSDVVEEIVRSVTRIGNTFETMDGVQIRLRAPETAIDRAAIPLHDGLRSYLIHEGHIGRDYSIVAIFAVVLSLIAFVVSVQVRMRSYDRMGNLLAAKGTITYTLYQAIAKSGTALIVLFVFFLIVVVFVQAIQISEAEYARRLNVRNPFADRGFWNSLLWVVTFMGAGDPGDVFPNSDMGKFLASLLPFIGIGAVLGFGYSALENRREKRLREREGTLIRSVRDHVLICGWNEKAPGIIFTLTGPDVPRKRHVIVVAEMDGRTPLDKYPFNVRYVSYCRGDSADHKVLERANAEFADVAVVLSGFKKRSARNIKSVLSVLALRKLTQKNAQRNDEAMIIAELMFGENESLFEKCGADSIVSSEAIADRVATMSCVSPIVVDFVLDMLTYDDRSELYALPRNDAYAVLGLSQDQTINLDEIASELLPLGVNVVASNNTRFEDPTFLDHAFTGEKFGLRLDAGNEPVQEQHELLVIADDYKEVNKLAKRGHSSRFRPVASKPDISGPADRHVILVGHQDRCEKVASSLTHFGTVTTTIIGTNNSATEKSGVIVGEFTDEAVWKRAGLASAHQVTILAESHDDVNLVADRDVNEVDARGLLITKFAREYCQSRGATERPIVVAEMLSAANQKLFEDAGADVVIPVDLMMERAISKLVYSRGAVTRFLMALLRPDDGRHFASLVLQDPDACTCFEDLVESMPDYFQLLGVLPGNRTDREPWKNSVGDFQYHFLTTPTQDGADKYMPKPGDALVGIIDQSMWLKMCRQKGGRSMDTRIFRTPSV